MYTHVCIYIYMCVYVHNLHVAGILEHVFHKLGMIIPTDSCLSEGWLNHQPDMFEAQGVFIWRFPKIGVPPNHPF